MDDRLIEEKSWDDFRQTGLFMFINTVLHAFGWALVVDVDVDYDVENEQEHTKVKRCYPARVKYRGFTEADQDWMHERIGEYLGKNGAELEKEVK